MYVTQYEHNHSIRNRMRYP